MESWRRNPLVFWIFLVPPTIWLLAFFLIPLGLIFAFSFSEKRGIIEMAFTGTLDNYLRALDPLYLGIFLKSFWFAGLTTLACLVWPFPLPLPSPSPVHAGDLCCCC